MEKNKEQALEEFLGQEETTDKKKKTAKKEIMIEREGLIERVDKIYVTPEGKQLLREQY